MKIYLFHFTDTGAILPIKCPLGYKMYDGSPQDTFANTCESCRPGYYGKHDERALCLPCRAGVVCHQTATTDQPLANGTEDHSYEDTRSYLCPPGENTHWLKMLIIGSHLKLCFFFYIWLRSLYIGWNPCIFVKILIYLAKIPIYWLKSMVYWLKTWSRIYLLKRNPDILGLI